MRKEVIVNADLLTGLHDKVIPTGLLLTGTAMPNENGALFPFFHGFPERNLVRPALVLVRQRNVDINSQRRTPMYQRSTIRLSLSFKRRHLGE